MNNKIVYSKKLCYLYTLPETSSSQLPVCTIPKGNESSSNNFLTSIFRFFCYQFSGQFGCNMSFHRAMISPGFSRYLDDFWEAPLGCHGLGGGVEVEVVEDHGKDFSSRRMKIWISWFFFYYLMINDYYGIYIYLCKYRCCITVSIYDISYDY